MKKKKKVQYYVAHTSMLPQCSWHARVRMTHDFHLQKKENTLVCVICIFLQEWSGDNVCSYLCFVSKRTEQTFVGNCMRVYNGSCFVAHNQCILLRVKMSVVRWSIQHMKCKSISFYFTDSVAWHIQYCLEYTVSLNNPCTLLFTI